eukprot:GHVL01009443.1.p1 GENE.GHVL01009443.1~~GHVL01009443.1.p1  ORF type:complete len:115 (-),score=10.75 GHVL01009443.1:127-471(-)
MASKTGVKRKQASHTIAFKIKVLEELDKKQLNKTEICKKFSIANSTLSTFIKNRQKIEDAYVSCDVQTESGRERVLEIKRHLKRVCFNGLNRLTVTTSQELNGLSESAVSLSNS